MFAYKKPTRRAAFELALAAGLLVTLGCVCFSQLCARVRADTLRLHVVANSDSAVDQALKLEVRDAVLACAGDLFAETPDKASALEAAEESLGLFKEAARQRLAELGSDQQVEVKLVKMRFATTCYEDFTLPAGEYDALRVELGEAKGHNWFCVLYPGLCLPAARKKNYTDPEENALVTGNYAVGFALVDWLEKL